MESRLPFYQLRLQVLHAIRSFARQDLEVLNLEGKTSGTTKALRDTLSYAKEQTELVVPTHEACQLARQVPQSMVLLADPVV